MTKDSVLPTAAVLVVEHSAAIRRLFEVVLREVADPLFVVADQEAAREILAGESIDVVVLEPHSATEFSWGLLDDLTKSAIPVIVVTSRAEEQVQEEAIRRGALAFLAKPFSPALLQSIVSAIGAEDGKSGLEAW
jgi:DNA-binding NtrC family response regulator